MKLFVAAFGFAAAAGAITAGNIKVNGNNVGTYSDFTVNGNGTLDINSTDFNGGGSSGNAAPTASFTSNCPDLSCSFNGGSSSDSDGTIVSYQWSFGDGSGGNGSTASHSYSDSNTYTVRLTVTDDAGATGFTTKTITVGNTSTGGGTPASCDGVGQAGSGGSLFTTGLNGGSVTGFPTVGTGGNYIISADRDMWRAIKFTVPTSPFAGSMSLASTTQAPATGSTMAISKCPGDFADALPPGACRWEGSFINSMYFVNVQGYSVCTLQPGETYYVNYINSKGTGNNLTTTCNYSTCGHVFSWKDVTYLLN